MLLRSAGKPSLLCNRSLLTFILRRSLCRARSGWRSLLTAPPRAACPSFATPPTPGLLTSPLLLASPLVDIACLPESSAGACATVCSKSGLLARFHARIASSRLSLRKDLLLRSRSNRSLRITGLYWLGRIRMQRADDKLWHRNSGASRMCDLSVRRRADGL